MITNAAIGDVRILVVIELANNWSNERESISIHECINEIMKAS